MKKIALEEHFIFPELMEYFSANKQTINEETYDKAVQVASVKDQATQVQPVQRQYRKMAKQRKPHPPHTWRNRKDPLEDVSSWLRSRVLDNPKLKIGKLLKELQRDFPGKYSEKHKRTLARRLKEWRAESKVHSPEKWAEPTDSFDTPDLQQGVASNVQKLRKNGQPRKPHPPHTWRNRKDPFEDVSEQLKLRVLKNPSLTVGKLFKDLEREHPGKYSKKKLSRTLHRRLKEWRAASG